MHSITRDARGRFVPVVRPKSWNASSVVRSRERSDRIATARMERKKTLATTHWLVDVDRRAIAELEATGIPWSAVERWLDAVDPREAFLARRLVRQVLHVLADGEVPLRGQLDARNELYRRLIAASIVD